MSAIRKKLQAEVKQVMADYRKVVGGWRHNDSQVKAILDAAVSLSSQYSSIRRSPAGDILSEEQLRRLFWRVWCDLEDLFQQLRQFQ